MADILNFKKGLAKNLSTQNKVAGTVYITTDEKAMYVDIDASTRIRIGDFVRVATVNDVPKEAYESTLYYVEDSNALLGCKDGKWTQINSTAELDTRLDDLEIKINGKSETTEGAGDGVNGLIKDVSNLANIVGPLSTDFNTLSEEFDTLSTNFGKTVTAIGLDKDYQTGLEKDNLVDAIKELYGLVGKDPGTGEEKGLIERVTDLESGVETINNTLPDKADIGTNADSWAQKKSLWALSKDVDTRITTANTTLQSTLIGGSSYSTLKGLEDNVYKKTQTYSKDEVNTVVNNSAIALTETINNVDGKFDNYYTKGVTEEKIATAIAANDAMTFKGIVNKQNSLPTTEVNRGDTYKVAEAHDYVVGKDAQNANITVSARIGDLFINKAGDGLTPDWEHISSGYEDDYNQHLKTITDNRIALTDGVQSNTYCGIIDFNDSAKTSNNGGISLELTVIDDQTATSQVTATQYWGTF